MAKAKEKSGNKDLVARIRQRFTVMQSADNDNREKAKADLAFCYEPGKQWDAATITERGNRPRYEFNKVRPTVKRVVNEMRKNRPQGKVRAVEDSDKDTADIYDGLIRNIWNTSDGDTVIDYAAEYQVAGGYGAWRVVTEYSSDSAFDQDILIKPFKDPFSLYFDNACQDITKRDARDWIVISRMAKETFQAKYGKAEVTNFEGEDDDDWEDEDSVRICEYWYKEPVTKTISLLATGETVEEVPEGAEVVRQREVKTDKIKMCIASGNAILEGPTDWAGSQFPFVVVYGDWLVVDGKTQWSGLVRFAKDAQRNYNYVRTAMAETIALAPQAKYLATPEQMKGLEASWATAHKENFPFLLYNADPKSPGPPQRVGGPEMPVALAHEANFASEEIKAVTGIFDASLGNESNETSGKAIMARQAQGDVATYHYVDNQGKGIRRTDEILIDLIPKVIDTERAMRILGPDGAEKYVKVNQVVVDPTTMQRKVVNDLSKGKVDVTVTIGPSFATQRMEAAETYTNLMSAMPEMAPAFSDLAVKAMDLPYSNEVAERLKTMLPPPIQQMLAQDKPLPPEVQAAMQQADQVMQMAQQHGQLVEKASQEVQTEQAESDKKKAEIQTLLAQLDTKAAQIEAKEAHLDAREAMFEAQVAQAGAQIDSRKADIKTQEAGLAVKEIGAAAREQEIEGKAQINEQQASVLEEVKQVTAELIQANAEAIQALQEAAKQRPKVSRLTRDAKGFIPEYEQVA